MGRGKKKDKRKKKRQRSSSSSSSSSSDSDGYDDRSGNYKSKSKSTYVVEDARPKQSQLQAIADNYSHSSKGEKKKRSKYDVDDDIPETEEYVYDQFGQQIVQKSRDMSMSSNSSGDEYDYSKKSSKYKEIYEKEKKSKQSASGTTKRNEGPLARTDKGKRSSAASEKSSGVPHSSNKSRTETVKSQINVVAPGLERKKEVIDLVDNSCDYMKKKETKDSTIYVSDDYGERKSLKEISNYVSTGYSEKKLASPSPSKLQNKDKPHVSITKDVNDSSNYVSSDYSQKKDYQSSKPERYKNDIEQNTSSYSHNQMEREVNIPKSQLPSSVNYSKYVSSQFLQNNDPPPPPPPPPPDSPPPQPVEYKKETYEQDILRTHKGSQDTGHVEPKSTVTNYAYISSDYPPHKNYDTSHEYYNKQNEYDSSTVILSKATEGKYASSEYTSKNNSHYNEPKSETVDYNSAEFLLKKIREQTKFKTSDDKVSDPKYDYTSSSYLPELKVEPDYTSHTQGVLAESNSGSAINSYDQEIYTREETRTSLYNAREQGNYSTSEYIPKEQTLTESTGYVSTKYAQENEQQQLSHHYTSNNVSLSGYNYDNESSKQASTFDYSNTTKSLRESELVPPGYESYEPSNIKSSDYNEDRDSHKQYDYDNSDYNYSNTEKQSYNEKYDDKQSIYDIDHSKQKNNNNKDNYTSEFRDSNREEDYVSSDYRSGSKHDLPSQKETDKYYKEYDENEYDYREWPEEDIQRKYNERPEKSDKAHDDPVKQKIEVAKDDPPPSASSSQDALSIEETNKLRAKLGLKPLNVDSGSSGTKEKSYAEREDVHRPATNLADKKSEEKMREKMEAIREKRKINKKLQKVKGLGEEDDPVLDSAAAWVAKSRLQEKEKELADKRAQMLEEMDEEFGVTKIMAKSILKKGSKYDEYSSRNLQGLKVEHRGSDLAEGESVILTLKDKDILDEDDEDVLYNVNVREKEKARTNLKNKNKQPGYQAYDEVDEETGEFRVRTILDKYDNEIDGEKRESFRIGNEGTADLEGENHIDKIRAILKSQQVTLTTETQLARDYLTTEEMTSFKPGGKRKKTRKIRKREVLKADDLLKMDNVDSQKDRGSRKLKSALKNSNREMEEDTSMDMDVAPTEPDELDYFVAVSQHLQEEEPLIEDNQAEQELEIALQRSRRAKYKSRQQVGDEDAVVERMAREVLSKQQVKEEADVVRNKLKKKNKGAIILDSTSEFCRTLGDLPTLPLLQQPEKEDKMDDDMDIEETPTTSATVNTVSGWEEVEITEDPVVEDAKEDDDDVLEAEPIPTGLAATLNLANMKGYLKDGKEKVRKFDPLNLPETKAEVDVEKLRDEEKNKYTRGYERERERDRYDPYAWKEKANYKPDIKLEYVDNKGRQMNQKEAFRLLSHKFHGKGSGKLKTEKRSKKLMDEKKLQMMSSIDTPLNTSALFKDKQKQSQSAYLVLSGGGKNILSGETLKK